MHPPRFIVVLSILAALLPACSRTDKPENTLTIPGAAGQDVLRLNECPVANAQAVSVDQGGSVNFQLTGSDADGDVLSFILVTGPSHGSVVVFGATGAASYQPAPGYCGPDGFSFRVSDGTCDSNVAGITITVNCANECPVADDATLVVDQDTSTPLQLSASDEDGDALSFAIVTAPQHGTVVLDVNTGSGTYTPAAGYCGPDDFTFAAWDGTCESNVATVTITVNCTSADRDGDGIVDDEDDCPDSDLSPTVEIGNCDTDVPNTVDEHGCSLADLIQNEINAASNHGRFMAALTRALQGMAAEGLIEPGQIGALLRCAGQSDVHIGN